MIEKLKRLIVDLKYRRGQHDNYNTSSSQQKGSKMYSTKKKDEEKKKKENNGKSSKTCKGQKEHKGKTCKPKSIECKTHTSNSCSRCGFDNLSITKTLKRNIAKALRTVKITTTSHSINTCRCGSCDYDCIESND